MDKELRKVLRFEVKTLVLQEIRFLQMERAFAPEVVMNEIARSIEDSKKEIVRLTRAMSYPERTSLLRRMVRKAVDEEVDRTIELRKNRCLRCAHGRFYDHSEVSYSNLPSNEKLVQAFGCDKLRPDFRKTCRRFVETATALSMIEYLDEMRLLYEFRELIDQIEEIWKGYFTK